MVGNGIKSFLVEIEGVKPLIMHSTRGMTEGPKNTRGGKASSEDEAKMGLYLDKEGNIVIPADVLLGVLKSSAVDFKVPGKGKKTFKNYIDSGLEIVPEAPPLISDGGWVIDVRPVAIKGSKILRSRPRFDDWKVQFTIQLNDPETFLDPYDKEYGGGSNIHDILEAAGQFKGICDYRPRFGRFKVTRFEPAPQ